MFELIATFCLVGGERGCVDRMIGTGGFEVRADCEAALVEIEAEYQASEMRCVPRPPSGVRFFEIDVGVFAHSGHVADFETGFHGDFSNTGFVIGETGVIAIDSGGAYRAGQDLYLAIREQTELPIVALALTHMHPDHVYGSAIFEAMDVPVYGHFKLERALLDRAESYAQNYGERMGEAEMLMSTLPRDILPVDGEVELDLGGRAVVLEAWQTAHSNNDMSVYDLKTRVFFAGDLLFDTHVPAIDGSIRGWQSVVEDIKAKKVAWIVPGHGAVPLPFPQGFKNQMRYFDVLVEDAKGAIERGERMGDAIETIGASEAGNWALFSSYNPRNATVVFSELEWG